MGGRQSVVYTRSEAVLWGFTFAVDSGAQPLSITPLITKAFIIPPLHHISFV